MTPNRPIAPAVALLALALAPPARAASEIPEGYRLVDVADGWRLSPVDDAKHADPALDDAAWSEVRLPGGDYRRNARLDHPEAPVVWYRKTLVAAPDARPDDARVLAFSLGPVYDGAQVFADGWKIGAIGSLAPEPGISAKRTTVYEIPSRLVADGRLVLAVRTEQSALLRRQPGGIRHPRLADGLFLVGELQAVRYAVDAINRARMIRFIIPMFAGAVFLMLIGLYHLGIWRRRRNLLSDLYFSAFCLAMGVGNFMKPLTDLGLSSVRLRHGWSSGFMMLGIAMIPLFVTRYVSNRGSTRYWRVLSGLAAATGLFKILLPTVDRQFLPVVVAEGLVGLVGLSAIAYALREALRGNRRAKGILLAVGCGLALFLLETADYRGLIDFVSRYSLPAPTLLGELAMVVVVSMELARNFAVNLNELDAAHKDLEITHEATCRFVPYDFLELLDRKSIRDVKRGDAVTLEITVFFSDIRSFTAISEKLSPTDVFRMINDYLGEMGPVIARNGGFIDKYIGDAIMALFRSPDDAVDGAVACLRALEAHNAGRTAAGQPPIRVGIGLHTGPLTLGTVGSEDRLSCTVLGDSVNLASRIESLTKRYGTSILLSEQTRVALKKPDRCLREVDRVRVSGKAEPVLLHEVCDADPEPLRAAKMATRGTFEEMLRQYRAGQFARACKLAAEVLEQSPHDGAAKLYLERAMRLAAEPPADWDGVTTHTSK